MNNFVKQISLSWIWRALSTFLRCFGMKVQFCLRNDYDRFYQNLRNTENIYFFTSWWWPACNGHSYCRQVTRFICVILRHAIQALKPKFKVSAPIWPPSICFMKKQAVSTGLSSRYFKHSPSAKANENPSRRSHGFWRVF